MTYRDRPPRDGQGHHPSVPILSGSSRRGATHPGDHIGMSQMMHSTNVMFLESLLVGHTGGVCLSVY